MNDAAFYRSPFGVSTLTFAQVASFRSGRVATDGYALLREDIDDA